LPGAEQAGKQSFRGDAKASNPESRDSGFALRAPRNDGAWIASSRSLSSGPPKAGPVGSSQ
jgi:hypothetical protein